MYSCGRIDKTVNKVDLLETGTDTVRAEAHTFTVVAGVDYLTYSTRPLTPILKAVPPVHGVLRFQRPVCQH